MKDPLLSNKIAFSVLAALLLVFGLPQLTLAILSGGHGGGHGDELHLAYCCVDLETHAPIDADETAPADLGTLLANANIAGGERRAGRCASCHTFDEGGANKNGPNLWDIVNRPVGSVAGFSYTSSVQAFGGAWSYERLNEYLKNSQSYLPGTAMAQRIARDDQRADILAYLGSLSANPAAFPVPTTAATPVEEASHIETNHIDDAAPASVSAETVDAEDTIDAAAKIENTVNDFVDAASDANEDGADIVDLASSAIEEEVEADAEAIEEIELAPQPEE